MDKPTAAQKEALYTARWHSIEIVKKSEDKRVDQLALDQMKILSDLLGEPMPKEFAEQEPDRPDSDGTVSEPVGQKLLWYPKALKRQDLKMKVIGNFPNGYPRGLCVHFTAGHYEKKAPENAIQTIKGGIKDGYTYACMDTDGTIVQTNPLSQYGYNQGTSAWIIDGKKRSGTSAYFFGLEMNNAGKLEKKGSKFYTWYKSEVPEKDVRYVAKDDDNIQAGYYHKYTAAQEKALVEFCLWLKANNPEAFSLDYVVGHDEVAGKKGIGYSRKNDPGASLSMNMTKFREYLKAEYKKRFGV